jgi:heptosyltransferase-3
VRAQTAGGALLTASSFFTAPRFSPALSPVTELKRILVIRGGAIGDFVLTLPAIKLLRDAFPDARLEILGHKHIAALAEKRFYADAVRSIESAALARFFTKELEPEPEFAAYFASFDLILSYLHDPDRIFENNVRAAGEALFLPGPSKLDNSEHASLQLARPLAALGLSLVEPAARIFPGSNDREAIRHLRADDRQSTIVLHPGSGSETKNWPVENWIALANILRSESNRLLIVAGEAERDRIVQLRTAVHGDQVQFAENLPLPQLAALLEGQSFVGHDSGISHVAAAVGARCLLLFGKTDPVIWAPANANVTVLRAPAGEMPRLEVETVAYELMRIGIRT